MGALPSEADSSQADTFGWKDRASHKNDASFDTKLK